MTVALLGVGADTSNCTPTPPVYPDGTFEYIPIPESEGPTGTLETNTFGNTPLRYQDGNLADYIQSITPRPKTPHEITGAKLREWPLHYDPNFEALTYGESSGRPAYINVLRQLQPRDVVGFYTGLQGETRFKHRYIIGYFTINDIIDFERIPVDGRNEQFSKLNPDDQMQLMNNHSRNAHAKRFQATGTLKHEDGLVIVDGTEPGRLLDTAFKISRHRGGGHYYLKDALQDEFSPITGDDTPYLGGFKQAHLLEIAGEEFIEIIDS